MARRVIASIAAVGLVAGAAVTAGVVVRGNGGGDLALLPLGASGAQTPTAEASTKLAADVAGSSMLFAPQNFVLADGLPAFDSDAQVWKLTSGPIDSARFQQLAGALGLSGEPTVSGDPSRPTWLIGPSDGTAPDLSVDGGAGARWWFNDPTAVQVATSCAVPLGQSIPGDAADATVGAVPATPDSRVSSTGEGVAPATAPIAGSGELSVVDPMPSVECPPPAPPVNVPTKAEAEAKGRALATAAGFGDLDLRWESTSDQWGASTSARLVLDGVATEEIWFSAGFGAEGRVQYANGLLGTPAKVGSYPRVGTNAAFATLQSGQNSMIRTLAEPVPAGAMAKDAVSSIGGGATTGMVEGVAPGVVSVAPECGPAVDCPPMSPVVPTTITLTGVDESLMSVYGSDEAMYLVPAYRFTADDGGWYPVSAIDPAFIAPSVPTEEPMATEAPVAVDPATPTDKPVAIEPDTATSIG